MSVVIFDTHAVVKQLVAAGFTDQQAEAVTRVVRDAQDVDISTLATKADLAVTKVDLKTELVQTRADMRADFTEATAAIKVDLAETMADMRADLAETKAEILKWMFGSMGFQIVVVIGAIVSLSPVLPR